MKNIFKNAKFGDKFVYNNRGHKCECIFLHRMCAADESPDMYKLTRKIDIKYEDGGEKSFSFSAEIIADKDGNVNDGRTVELSRKAVITSLVQLVPNYSVMERIPHDVGYYQGGMDDHWRWETPYSIMVNKKRSTEELYGLYLICKENCDDDLAEFSEFDDLEDMEDTSEDEVEDEEDMTEVSVEDKELLSLLENSVRSNLEHNFLKIFEK